MKLTINSIAAQSINTQAAGEFMLKKTVSLGLMGLTVLSSLCTVAQAQYNPNIQNNSSYGVADNATPYNPVATTGSGYANDGTLFMGGQRIGNPHQILHDAQIPAFMTITANRYTYTNNPNHGQGTLAQMEAATTAGSGSDLLLNRLYLSPNNPYVGQAAGPYPNLQTYQAVLANAQATGYKLAAADDGKTYAVKTLTAATTQAQNILVKELPNTAQFRAAADPLGGGVGVRVTQNGDTVALSNYLATVKPYDFSWQQGFGVYGNNWDNAPKPINNFNSFTNFPKLDNQWWEAFLASNMPEKWASKQVGHNLGQVNSGNPFFDSNSNNEVQADFYEKFWSVALRRAAPPVLAYATSSTILNRQTPEQQMQTARQLREGWDSAKQWLQSKWNSIVNSAPELPSGYVGDSSDSRSGSNPKSKKRTSGELTPENGGTGNPLTDAEELAGPLKPVPGEPGTYIGENGIRYRPENTSGGASIDIPANGDRKHETLHYPNRGETPDFCRATICWRVQFHIRNNWD